MTTSGIRTAVVLCVAALFLTGCDKSFPGGLDESEFNSRKYINSFVKAVIEHYYLWIDEVKEDMDSWKVTDEPTAKVHSLRYKDDDGKEVDKWTRVLEDYAAFMGSVDGNTTTFGMDFALIWSDESKRGIDAVVTYVYADSPASCAGLGRGDIITEINGQSIPLDGYAEFVKSSLSSGGTAALKLQDGRTMDLTAEQMYCDPLVEKKVFDCAGKKVGYLFYTSYTKDSRDSLKKAFAKFRDAGVSELILDLRYNGGGYDVASNTLCSLIAPREAVQRRDIVNLEIFNSTLSAIFGSNSKSVFDTTCLSSNINASKLYVIMTGSTASASEATICGLSPYMQVEKIGKQSYGKFCGGYIFEGEEWYEACRPGLSVSDWQNGKHYASNWGIYVMAQRYADRDGNTPCMPDGFTPDFEVADNPLDGHQLGDPQESMLKLALERAGYDFGARTKSTSLTQNPAFIARPDEGGILILEH